MGEDGECTVGKVVVVRVCQKSVSVVLGQYCQESGWSLGQLGRVSISLAVSFVSES